MPTNPIVFVYSPYFLYGSRFHLVSSHVSVQKYKNVFQQIAIVNLGYDVQNEKKLNHIRKGVKASWGTVSCTM